MLVLHEDTRMLKYCQIITTKGYGTLGTRFHVDVILENPIVHFVAYGFSLPSSFPDAHDDQYKVIVDTQTGVRQVVQFVFTPHRRGVAQQSKKACVENPNNETINMPTQEHDRSHIALVDDAILHVGKSRKMTPRDLDVAIADSRSSSISILDVISPLLDGDKSTRATSLTTSSTRSKLSPHADEFVPIANSVGDLDPAIVSCSIGTTTGRKIESSVMYGGKASGCRPCVSAAVPRALPVASMTADLDPAIISYKCKDPSTSAPIIPAANSGFPSSALDYIPQENGMLDSKLAIVEKNASWAGTAVPEVSKWLDLPISDAEKVCFDHNLECLKPLKAKLPLEELCLDVSNKQMTRLFDYIQQSGVRYEEALGDDDGPETDEVEWRSPVRPRENEPTYDEILTTSGFSSSFSSAQPLSPTSTNITTQSDDENDEVRALGVLNRRLIDDLERQEHNLEQCRPAFVPLSHPVGVNGPEDAINVTLLPESSNRYETNDENDDIQPNAPEHFAQPELQIEDTTNVGHDPPETLKDGANGDKDNLGPSGASTDIPDAEDGNAPDLGTTIFDIETQYENLFGSKLLRWEDEEDSVDLSPHDDPRDIIIAGRTNLNNRRASEIVCHNGGSISEDTIGDNAVDGTSTENLYLEDVASITQVLDENVEDIHNHNCLRGAAFLDQVTYTTSPVFRIPGLNYPAEEAAFARDFVSSTFGSSFHVPKLKTGSTLRLEAYNGSEYELPITSNAKAELRYRDVRQEVNPVEESESQEEIADDDPRLQSAGPGYVSCMAATNSLASSLGNTQNCRWSSKLRRYEDTEGRPIPEKDGWLVFPPKKEWSSVSTEAFGEAVTGEETAGEEAVKKEAVEKEAVEKEAVEKEAVEKEAVERETVDVEAEDLETPSTTPIHAGRSISAGKMFRSQEVEEVIESPSNGRGSWEENEDGGFDSPIKSPIEYPTGSATLSQDALEFPFKSPAISSNNPEEIPVLSSNTPSKTPRVRLPPASPSRLRNPRTPRMAFAEPSLFPQKTHRDGVSYLTPTSRVASSINVISGIDKDEKSKDGVGLHQSFVDEAKKIGEDRERKAEQEENITNSSGLSPIGEGPPYTFGPLALHSSTAYNKCYGVKHLFAAIALAFVVGLLWKRLP